MVRFQKIGRSFHLIIDSIADLYGVLELDESLWMATSAPVSAFSCDAEFLGLIDSNHDGRINTTDVQAAIEWLLKNLAATAQSALTGDAMPLTAIDPASPDGEALAASARYVLKVLDSANTDKISIDQVRSFAAGVRERPLNGDGVIIPEAADTPDLKQYIVDVAGCIGSTADANGRPGVTESDLTAFVTAINDYITWREQGAIPEGAESTPTMPLGPKTPAAYGLLNAHASKIDSFFEVCDAVLFEPQAAEQIKWWQTVSVTPDQDSPVRTLLQKAPLARPTADGLLPLNQDEINPIYRSWIADLKEQVLLPVLGESPEQLTVEDWSRVTTFFAPYAQYLAAKKGSQVERLPFDRLLHYRDSDLHQQARELIAASRDVAKMLEGVEKLKKLLLYRQYLVRLCNNFVSFPEMYSATDRALFERGRAVIDGRWFNFAADVDDVAAHSAVARQGSVFTLYLEVTAKDPGTGAIRKFNVVSPATSGTKGNLAVGKRGVFFDTDGNEYDARVISIIENPISVREAFAAPFSRLWQFIIGKIEALAGRSEKGLEERASYVMAPQAPAPQPQAAPTPGTLPTTGLFVGLSVAFAALTSSFAYILKTFASLTAMQIGIGLAALAFVIFAPIVLLAILKLRRRDLAAILEGGGWAINARMRLNRAQRRHFTCRMQHPSNAEGAPNRRRTVILIIVFAIAIAFAAFGLYAAFKQPSSVNAPAVADPHQAQQSG